jgi:hypothetical protein
MGECVNPLKRMAREIPHHIDCPIGAVRERRRRLPRLPVQAPVHALRAKNPIVLARVIRVDRDEVVHHIRGLIGGNDFIVTFGRWQEPIAGITPDAVREGLPPQSPVISTKPERDRF